jgi:hypothetical protein
MLGMSRNYVVHRVVATGMSATLLHVVGNVAYAQVAKPVAVPDLVVQSTSPEELGDYDPLNVRLGSFVLSPSLVTGEEFETNIFTTQSGAKSDFITVVQPSLNLVSDWGVDAIALHAAADVEQFARFTSENAHTFVIDGEGRLDILSGQYLEANIGYQSLQELRSAPESIETVMLAGGTLARSPTQFSVETANLNYVYAPGLIKLELKTGLIDYQFSNTPTTNGDLAINSDQSRAEYTVTPEVSYEFLPGYQAYFQVSGGRHQYDSTFDATPEHLRRSSTGYATATGIDIDITKSLVGNFFVGYEEQLYDDRRLNTNQGVYTGGSLVWHMTELTSISLGLSRAIDDTIIVGSSGFWDTEASITVNQELHNDLMVTGTVAYINSDYQGIALNNDRYDIKGGVVWKLNRNFAVNLTAEWLRQDSNILLQQFDQKDVELALKVSL